MGWKMQELFEVGVGVLHMGKEKEKVGVNKFSEKR